MYVPYLHTPSGRRRGGGAPSYSLYNENDQFVNTQSSVLDRPPDWRFLSIGSFRFQPPVTLLQQDMGRVPAACCLLPT